MLTESEKLALLGLARRTLEAFLADRPAPPADLSSPGLREPRGVFVTLKRDGLLRGCIGWVAPRGPLADGVREMALAAAEDPRLEPVQASELPSIRIEISALTPPRRVRSPEEVRVGEHGLIIRRGADSGLLLPQVAVEHRWDRGTFLRQTCRKAGLPQDAWEQAGTEISIFEAEVFGEEAALAPARAATPMR
jgi:AmmeMemoRadiSam system protein A